MKKKTSVSTKASSALGWGVAAGLVSASYYLYGTDAGVRKRRDLKGWAIKAKGEVIDKIEKLTKIDEKTYKKLIEDVLAKYKKLKSVDPKEVYALGEDLKKHWKKIEKQLS